MQDSEAEGKRKAITAELRELDARVLLGKHEQTLLDEIERKKKVAAFGQCIEETKPTAITQKGSAVTKAVVSERLKKRGLAFILVFSRTWFECQRPVICAP